MDSQFLDAGTYAWIVIIIFFVIFSSLQIRNCIRNVRNNNGNFAEMYPNEAGTSCGQGNRSSVYTIDVHGSTPSTPFTNGGYVSTEGAIKSNQTNDGLPTYEEAIAGIKSPIQTPPAPIAPARPSVEVVNEENTNGSSSRGRRHRHHRRHRSHNSDRHNENAEPEAPEEQRRHRHRRGFRLRRHLAKINRRNNTETD